MKKYTPPLILLLSSPFSFYFYFFMFSCFWIPLNNQQNSNNNNKKNYTEISNSKISRKNKLQNELIEWNEIKWNHEWKEVKQKRSATMSAFVLAILCVVSHLTLNVVCISVWNKLVYNNFEWIEQPKLMKMWCMEYMIILQMKKKK